MGVDDTPELPEPVRELLRDAQGGTVEVESSVAELPPPPPVTDPVTAKDIARDAGLDLLAALFLGLSLIIVAAVALGAWLMFYGRGPGELAAMFTSPWGIAGLLLATQMPLLFFALRRRRRNREKGRPLLDLFGGTSLHALPIGVFAGLGMTILSGIYTSALQAVLGKGSIENQVEFLEKILGNTPAVALLVLLIAGVAPICEELFFRGVIFGSARAVGLEKAGMWISAALFAAVHLSWLLAPFYATFAIVMCRLYARAGTLAAPMAAHATLNGVACAALFFAGNRV